MENKTLITAAEVVELAFGGAGNLREEEVSEATIIAAQRKYLLPVLGASLLEEMEGGAHSDLVENYLKLALALYVKRLLLPALAVKVGVAGVVRYVGEGYAEVDAPTFRRLLQRTKFDADVVLDAVVDYVEQHPALFPNYVSANNIRHCVNIDSGIVL